jgi:ribosomal protein S18 acetylase RimI-like enzyme
MNSATSANAGAVIRAASHQDFATIREIAIAAWKVAYKDILSAEFMAHEWEREYSDAALSVQTEALGHQFLILEEQPAQAVGFSSFSVQKTVAELHKLYLLPEAKGLGYGKALIAEAEARARALGCDLMELKVNRANPSVAFYQKLGYSILREADTVVGDGFIRTDYVMRKSLKDF